MMKRSTDKRIKMLKAHKTDVKLLAFKLYRVFRSGEILQKKKIKKFLKN